MTWERLRDPLRGLSVPKSPYSNMDAFGLFPLLPNLGGSSGIITAFQLPYSYAQTADIASGSGDESLRIDSKTISVDLSPYSAGASFAVIYLNRFVWYCTYKDHDDQNVTTTIPVVDQLDSNELLGPFILRPGMKLQNDTGVLALSNALSSVLIRFSSTRYMTLTSNWALELVDPGFSTTSSRLYRYFGFYSGYVFFY